MKKLFFTLVGVMFFAVASFAQGQLKFNKSVHDFGEVAQKGTIYYTFEVTNVGTAPVVISNAQATCGCTTPEWSKQPIMPGAKSTIKVGYDAENRPGVIDKNITVISNAENGTEVLKIKGKVIPKGQKTAGK